MGIGKVGGCQVVVGCRERKKIFNAKNISHYPWREGKEGEGRCGEQSAEKGADKGLAEGKEWRWKGLKVHKHEIFV